MRTRASNATTPRRTPQQNGVVECCNQTVVAIAHALLKQRGMVAIYWGEAVMTAIHLLNRSPTKALDGKTPYCYRHNLAGPRNGPRAT
jgi:hypothetical protein